MKTTSSEHVAYTNCFLFWHSEQFVYTICSELVVFMYWAGKSMNNLLSYCGLVNARISACEKDVPAHHGFLKAVLAFCCLFDFFYDWKWFIEFRRLFYLTNDYAECPWSFSWVEQFDEFFPQESIYGFLFSVHLLPVDFLLLISSYRL